MGGGGVVVTLLSPSPAASRYMKHRIQQWTTGVSATAARETKKTASEESMDVHRENDELDKAILRTQNPFWKFGLRSIQRVDSVVWQPPSRAANSGAAHTVIQWISLASKNDDANSNSANTSDQNGLRSNGKMQIFAIQALSNSNNNRLPLLEEARSRLAQKLLLEKQPSFQTRNSSPLRSLRTLGSLVSGSVQVHDLLPPYNSTLPWLDLAEVHDDNKDHASDTPCWDNGQLKEIVLPVDDNGTSHLFDVLGRNMTCLHRPVTGLYQIPSTNLCLRPLPTALLDRSLSPPTLIFHQCNKTVCTDVVSAPASIQKESLQSIKIGYSGRAGNGQLLLRENEVSSSVWNMDVRLCSATRPSSMFAEAQESLLASSLSELQSSHVLTYHSKQDSTTTRDDYANLNKAGCLVEFHAILSNPLRFLPRSTSPRPKIAKAPDLPYE